MTVEQVMTLAPVIPVLVIHDGTLVTAGVTVTWVPSSAARMRTTSGALPRGHDRGTT